MSTANRLKRLEQEIEPDHPIYKIEYCTEEEAWAMDAQRPPARPGEIRYIIERREHETA